MNKARSILVPLFLFIIVFFMAGCAQRVQTVASAPSPPTPVEKAAIQQALLHATAEGAEEAKGSAAQVKLEQLALDSGYALTTWTRGEQGGQAVLQWESGSWHVLAHESGWMGVHGLVDEGVPDQIARSLLDQIDPNWPSYERF